MVDDCILCGICLSCRRRREATFSTRHPDSKVPLIDAAKDVVTDTATGVMDYGVSSGEAVLRWMMTLQRAHEPTHQRGGPPTTGHPRRVSVMDG